MHSVSEEHKVKSTYNGWSNRETWMVNLWMSNEELYYYMFRDILRDYDSTFEQAEKLESYVRYMAESAAVDGLAGDMLNTALGRVDWLSIVESNQE